MMRDEFIQSIEEGALQGYEKYGILPSLTIAQAILESGWGSSQLSKSANNLFGIKAFSDWTRRRINLPTTEWYDGQMKIVNAEFRAYDSFNDSIEDHNKLLSFARYKTVRECTDYRDACRQIYECGYATDPRYTEKLISIIEKNRLFEYDNIFGAVGEAVSKSDDKIRKFQQLCNALKIRDYEGTPLEEDNILGDRTKSCIEKMPVLSIGSQGKAVEFVQDSLNTQPLDGDFGPITCRYVMDFQRDKGITVDGVVGIETWGALIS
jgi:peptidoglycan hydrolase-like protein with peptidoglycan-binding domain